MATTIQESEAIPTNYPETPSGLSTAAAALDADMIWARIEAYIAHRWTARSVIWVIDGGGEWNVPLAPATVSATEQWIDLAWVAITPDASALGGYVLDGDGPFRITASVGSGTVPPAVDEAFVRLIEYAANTGPGPAGATSSSHDVGGAAISHDRSASWLARALQNSGAADLLRPFRKV